MVVDELSLILPGDISGHDLWAVHAPVIWTMVEGQERVADGIALGQGHTITAVGPYSQFQRDLPAHVVAVETALAPGLFNSHVHLELSHLKGATVSGKGFLAWVKSLMASPMQAVDEHHVRTAVRRMRDQGTVFAADIATRRPELTSKVLAEDLPLSRIFAEFIGFSGPQPPSREFPWPPTALEALKAYPDKVSAAGHALYSTSAELLQHVKAWCRRQGKPFSIHLAEHEGEEMALSGIGELYAMLSQSLIPASHVPPEKRPMALAHELGLLDSSTLAVHCVRLSADELAVFKETGTSLCLCPRSNEYIGVGQADWKTMRKLNIPLCLGTDSLASNTDLSLWNELRFLLEKSPTHITLAEALMWMTVNPARIMGYAAHAGTLAPGKLAAFSVVPGDLSGL
ncbi:MAG: hypothetical protein D6E12_00280 [Desulfovibrio sp.]|nr:MAG: hypothetical protein D6E12_00280 [Desulfovibrio sp.]